MTWAGAVKHASNGCKGITKVVFASPLWAYGFSVPNVKNRCVAKTSSACAFAVLKGSFLSLRCDEF
jgi:hypothetical protein